jgi:hypothetical protein
MVQLHPRRRRKLPRGVVAMPPPKIDYEANQRLLDAKSQELFGKPYSELERFEITEVTRKTPLAPLKGENYKSSHWDESKHPSPPTLKRKNIT